MGGFLGIGGKNSKQQNQSVNNLENTFNYGFDAAKGATAAGNESLGTAGSYFKNILSGSRPAMSQAVAPETNAVASQADATKRQASTMGTARGGGTAGAQQTAKDAAMAKIDNLLFGVRPEAAKETAQIGEAKMQEGAGLFNVASGSASKAGDIATGARKQAGDEQQGIISDIFGFASL